MVDNAAVMFRSSKKRKAYRHRSEELSATATNELNEDDVSVSELLRLRKRNHKTGVEFRVDQSRSVEDEAGEEPADSQQLEVIAATGKFAPQTGNIGDVNKHMMAYIDSQLAKQQLEPSTASIPSAAIHRTRHLDPEKQPAALGKLLEIDLGDETRAKNIERTELARRRLGGETEEEELRVKKPRLGRDGKPWRGRKRRTSDEIQRDKLVEEVLRENRLDLYDEPETSNPSNDAQAADDRIAEEFRREFLDAVSMRQRKKAAPTGGKQSEEPKGPKLGGSRSARAAMREMQLRAGKK